MSTTIEFDADRKVFVRPGSATVEPIDPSDLVFFKFPSSYVPMFQRLLSVGPNKIHINVEINLTPKIRETLFDYQLEDVTRAIRKMNGRAILGHEMGCGKTIISISIATHYAGKVLVICPSYLRANWRAELVKWGFTTDDRIDVIKKTKQEIAYDDSDVVVISYDLAVNKIDDLAQLKFKTIIVDESQYMKNRNTKRVITLQQFLKRSSDHLLLLSGTPATNCTRDLFVQLHILYPHYFCDYFDFSRRYCDGKKGPFGWEDRGYSNVSELNFVLQNLMIRRLKKHILKDLPGKRRMKLFVEAKITTKMKKNMSKLEELNKKLRSVSSIDNAAPHLHKMFKERMYLISQMFTELSYTKNFAIIDYVRNTLEVVRGEKFIVFAHHSHVIDSICKFLDKQQVGHIVIQGSTNQDTRQDLVDEFVRSGSSKQVAVLSLKAASTGLNFTPVAKMIFAELLWEIATLKQSEDRINRIGCSHICEYYYLIAKDTIDERVFSNVSRKHTILDRVLDNGADSGGFSFVS